MVAELFLAVFAGDTGVRAIREALRVHPKRDLPAKQEQKRHSEQAPRVEIRDEHQRREHHREVPIIYAADCTASVFHKPGLKGAEKQDADHVADSVREADEDEDAAVDDTDVMQESDRAIQRKPCQCDGKRALPRLKLRVALAGGAVIARELLLTAHAFNPRREEAARHLRDVREPYYSEKPMLLFKSAEEGVRALDSADNIKHAGTDEQQRPTDQLDVMKQANGGELSFVCVHSFSIPFEPAICGLAFLPLPRGEMTALIYYIIIEGKKQ